MKGFLTADAPTKRPLPLVAQCGSCQLYKHCKSPKMPVDGKGKRKILICAEAPGKEEDEQNRPLVGPSGQTLWSALSKFGVERDDCWITNSIICRSMEDGSNRTPTANEISYCRPNVVRAIQELRPRTIILLGACSIKSILGWLWREDVGSAERLFGWQIPCQRINAYLCPTWHPSAFNYMSQEQAALARLFFEKHLEVACGLEGRPNKEPEPKVFLEYDPDAAASMIDAVRLRGRSVAFDIETNMLHPYHADAEIVCCSIADKDGAFAFPWHGRAIKSMESLLKSERVKKYGWNIRFESLWVRKKLGFWVKGWEWDGMLATHVLDNRPDICSLSFQSFVRLGADHKEGMDKYLKAKGSNAKNKIREAPLDKLMTYCAHDSLAEYRIAELQRKEMGL